jgi:hypothetical protein
LRMSRYRNSWKNRLGLSVLGAFTVSLSVGWWLDHQRQIAASQIAAVETRAAGFEEPAAEASTVRSIPMRPIFRPALPRSKPTYQALQSQNDDLILFADEVYTLLYEKGIHVQLDIEKGPDGHLRLKADTLKLLDELDAKAQTPGAQIPEALAAEAKPER